VAMTAPVLSREPEKIAMTAPSCRSRVRRQAGRLLHRPSLLHDGTIRFEGFPRADSPVPPFTAAVLRYGG